MDINPKILTKVKELTDQNLTIGEFIIELLKFESGESGWYKDTYNSLIEKYFERSHPDANTRN